MPTVLYGNLMEVIDEHSLDLWHEKRQSRSLTVPHTSRHNIRSRIEKQVCKGAEADCDD